MPLLAVLGIENDAVSMVVNLLLLFVVALWLALVFWTYKDAVRRIPDPVLVVCATLASFVFPFVGTIVYLILRPPEYLEDVHERELEIAAAEARLVQMHESACPYCAFPVERTFLRCPSCLKRLKEPCANCRKPLDPRWRICPYCEGEVGMAEPQRRPRRGAAERQRAEARAPAGERAAGAEAPPPGTGSRPQRRATPPPSGGPGADGGERSTGSREPRPAREAGGPAPADADGIARRGSPPT